MYLQPATGKGKVVLDMILPNDVSKSCILHSLLYVLKLSYNLVSVSVSEKGKIKSACYILDKTHKTIAQATKIGSLYQLDHKVNME